MRKNTNKPQVAIYKTFGDEKKISVRIENENVWLTQKLIAGLFGVDVRTVNEHLKNIFDEGELDQKATIRKFRIVQKEASREVTRDVKHYNLEVVLVVGYRVRSDEGTQFRKWATEALFLSVVNDMRNFLLTKFIAYVNYFFLPPLPLGEVVPSTLGAGEGSNQ